MVHVVDGEWLVMSCDVDGDGPIEAAIKAADGATRYWPRLRKARGQAGRHADLPFR